MFLFGYLFIVAVTLCNGNIVVNYSIDEEVDIGTVVGNLMTDSGVLLDELNKEPLEYEFSFLTENVNLFSVDVTTGVLSTAHRIDRDTLCTQEQPECIVNVDVIIKPVQILKILKVQITIIDINDHRPEFPIKSTKLAFLESTVIGTAFHLPAAEDIDSGLLGIQSYILYPKSEIFTVSVLESMDGSKELKLTLVQPVDREEKDTYTFFVVAQDGGSPSRSGRLKISIEVEDVNDNVPKFDNVTLTVEVQENADYNTALVTVVAKDLDSGENGHVSYKFSPRTFQAYNKLFYIENTTGTVYAKQPLDYETSPRYILAITAIDNGTPPKYSQITLIVDVLDLNDNPPTIVVNTLTSGDSAEVSEHATEGTFIAFVSVSDADSGRNGIVICNINEVGFALQEVYHGQYKIITAMALDREKQSFYTLSLNCFDNGAAMRMSSVSLTILVTDENDHTPVFSHNTYYGKISENNEVDQAILMVNATDSDSGNNGEIRYNLRSGDEVGHRLIHINPITGLITAKAIFDHETMTQLTLEVIAYDLGPASGSATTTVKITVLDQNDEPPKFGAKSYDFNVKENQEPGLIVGHVVALDADSPPYNQFEFQLHGFTDTESNNTNDSTNHIFQIDPKHGTITSLQTLDREEVAEYFIQVWAVNQAQPPMTSSVQVRVNIDDENDNTPLFIYPVENNNTVYIFRKPEPGYSFAQITGIDYDTDKNSQIHYAINSASGDSVDSPIFRIDEDSGILSFIEDHVELKEDSYSLKLTISDEGIPSRSTSTLLNIIVDDELATVLTLDKSVGPSEPNSIFHMLTDRFTILVAIVSGAATLMVVFCVVIIITWCNSTAFRSRDEESMDQEAIYESDVIYKKRDMSKSASGSILSGSTGRKEKKKKKTFKNGGITTDSSFTFIKVGDGLRVRDPSDSQEEYLERVSI